MRTLAAIVVCLVQAAGPWLCCCVPGRLFAASPAPCCAHKATPPVAKPAACPHCRTAEPQGEPAKPAEPAAPADDCPRTCPYAQTLDALPPAGDSATVVGDLSHPAASAEWLPVADAALSPIDRLAAGGTDLPFLSAEARLYAHHVLRC